MCNNSNFEAIHIMRFFIKVSSHLEYLHLKFGTAEIDKQKV